MGKARPAEQGFTFSSRSAQQGFTLIELMVAVLIFAMLSVAGVMLLRGSVNAQAAVRENLEGLGSLQRGISTLDADLAQASGEDQPDGNGNARADFYGRAAQHDMPLMQFVRAGWSNPGDLRRSTLQKVEYWWRDGRIERVGYAFVDGSLPPDPAPLVDDVTALTLRYRAADGAWLDVWAPQKPEDMPVAVELTVTKAKAPPLVLMFLVGAAAGQAPKPVESAAPPPGPPNGV